VVGAEEAAAQPPMEAIGILDFLDNPNPPRALNYCSYATRKLGRTDEGIGDYLKSVKFEPSPTIAGARVPWGGLCNQGQL
jgi:hypothetical protein